MPDLPTSISSRPAPKAPLILPRMIFLCGVCDRNFRQDVVEAICVETLSTVQESFEGVVYDAASSLFSQFAIEDDAMTPLGLSFSVFVEDLKIWLSDTFTPSALGHLALSRLQRDDDVWDNFIFPDASNEAQILPIMKHYGVDQCLLLIPTYEGWEFNCLDVEAELQNIPLRIVTGFNSAAELIPLLRCLPRPSQPWKNDHRHEGSAA